jgi:hypothetical protein
MNKYIVIALFICCSNQAFSQSIYPYEEIPLKTAADFRAAEPFALTASTFLLSSPYKQKDPERERTLNFLIKWTAGSRDYHFELHGVILELIDEKDLMSLFIPAMAKFCLENKALGSNTSVIEKSAVKMVLDYCNNPANNFTLKKKHRKKLEGS